MYVFMLTHRGDRTNIMANFMVVDTKAVIDHIKGDGKTYDSAIRFAKIGSHADNLKCMSLKQYEELFLDAGFSKKQITSNFRKEISEKYGEHADRKEMKRIPKKQLVPGQSYKVDSGDEFLFLGKCHVKIHRPENSSYLRRGTVNLEYAEYVYVGGYSLKRAATLEDLFIYKWSDGDTELECPSHTKSIKKFVSVGDFKFDMPSHLKIESSSKQTIEIKFLGL